VGPLIHSRAEPACRDRAVPPHMISAEPRPTAHTQMLGLSGLG